jgi:RNA polymerase-binding transcription factor DksA
VKKSAPAKVAPAKKAVASPVKAAAAKKAEAAKTIPAKKSAPVKAAATVKAAAKPAPEKAAPKKAAVASPEKTDKKVAKPASVADTPQPKKETKAEQRAALKRTASAVQRVQAKVAAAIPKPQPKPAPMPTEMPGREEKKSNVVVAHRRLETKPKQEDTSMTMINYQPDFTRSILDRGEKDTSPLYRYSDEELTEFRELISARLATARKELAYQQGLITHKDATGTEDTENRYMNMEDGSGAMEREQLAQLASRQIQFINHLEKAMVRIENKTYGICRVTGKLIDKARLRAVPHATLSIEAKNMMSK